MKPPSPHNSEWLTRKQFIDGKLEAAGWKVVPLRVGASVAEYERCAVEEYETANGPADYALCMGGQVVGVVEAKKLTLGPMYSLRLSATPKASSSPASVQGNTASRFYTPPTAR